MIAKGFSRDTIHKFLEKEYGIAYRQRMRVIKEATEEMSEAMSATKQDIVAVNNNRLDHIYEKTYKDKDYKNAIKTVDLINKMNGVYNTDNNTDNNDKEIKIKFG